ncbi:hypothetical protein SAMN05421747_103264 [Parapedobacter composti]|uniref:LTXXQ motif family protein n=1 Tax=Parapedobacter composti TaxID=623281 RepID=A0A1I1FZ69_9SPHI|nr:hypothetical protein [Parapedobacter composti]SFC04899.1 hypothetical protein SAMN05421747_103264 [Parapedobacter composti]
MKQKILFTVAVLLMAVGLSFGQQQRGGRGFGTPEENAKRTTERLAEQLKLSKAQQDSVYAYTLEQGKAMQQAFQANQNADRQQMMGKMRALREETDEKIRAVLDDSQKKAFEKMREEQASRMRQGGRRGGGSGNNG